MRFSRVRVLWAQKHGDCELTTENPALESQVHDSSPKKY
jgi:hypothetical protein